MACSLRAGGGSLAANKGIPDRLFKRYVRWKCDRANDGYVEDDLKMLLSVSKNLQNKPIQRYSLSREIR